MDSANHWTSVSVPFLLNFYQPPLQGNIHSESPDCVPCIICGLFIRLGGCMPPPDGIGGPELEVIRPPALEPPFWYLGSWARRSSCKHTMWPHVNAREGSHLMPQGTVLPPTSTHWWREGQGQLLGPYYYRADPVFKKVAWHDEKETLARSLHDLVVLIRWMILTWNTPLSI